MGFPITLDEMLKEALKETAIRCGNEEHADSYRINVFWYHMLFQKIPGTSQSIIYHLFNLVRLVLFIIHSNAEDESGFLHVKENLTPHCVFRIRWNSFKYSKLPVESACWRKMLLVQVFRKGSIKVQKSHTRKQSGTFQYKQEHSLKLQLFHVYLRCHNISCEIV